MKRYPLCLTGAFVTLCVIGCSTDQQQRDSMPQPGVTPIEFAYPLRAGQPQTGFYRGMSLSYRSVNGEAVYQGDILLNNSELTDPDRATEGAGRTLKNLRWTGRIVYYTIDPNLPDQVRVTDAIRHWEANTAIRFVPRTNQYCYVTFRPGGGCSSYIGRLGGQQWITLADWCSTGNTIHEIGHTIGLYHEQSRADRDSSVQVITANIMPGYTAEFQTYTQLGKDGFDQPGGFDFNSVMLYHSWSFSANGQPTMTKKDGSTFNVQRNGLSPLDMATVQTMYP